MSDLGPDDLSWERHEQVIQEALTEIHTDNKKWDMGTMREAMKQIAQGRPITKVAKDYDFSETTIHNVLNEVYPHVESWEAERTTDVDFSAVDLSEAEKQTGADFSEMDPGDFIEWFFNEDLEESDKISRVELFARQCRQANRLPSKDQMRTVLKEADTNVKNPVAIDWMCDAYWERARDYLAQKWGADPMNVDALVSEQNPAWLRVRRDRNSSSNPPSGMGNPQGTGSGGNATVAGPGGGHGGSINPQAGVSEAAVGQTEPKDPIDQLVEFEKKKQELQEALGMDGPSEQMQALNERLASLEQQIASGAVGGGAEESDKYSNYPENAPRAVQLAWLKDNAGMDPEEAKEWIDDYQDPDVQEVQFKRHKFDKSRETLENIVSDVTDAWSLESLADKAFGDESGGAAASDANLNTVPCPECGHEQEVDPNRPGFECESCGTEVDHCPQCRSRLILPPVGEEPGAVCPQCNNVAEHTGSGYSCTNCEWTGPRSEAQAGIVACDSCNAQVPRVSEADAANISAGGLNV